MRLRTVRVEADIWVAGLALSVWHDRGLVVVAAEVATLGEGMKKERV